MLNTNIKSKLVPIKLLGRKLVVYKDTLKLRINKNIYQLAQSRTTKTLLWQLLVIYSLGIQRVTYLIIYYIILFQNLMYIYKLLPIIDSNFLFSDLLFITFILYPILSILTLLVHQVLLASLLKIMGNIDSYNIVLNLIQSFNINIKIKEYLNNIVVKDIKGTPLLRPRLLKL